MSALRATVLFGWLALLALSAYPQETIRLKTAVPDSFPLAARQELARFSHPDGTLVRLSELNRRIEKIIGSFEDAGFPFVRISIDSVRATDGHLDGSLRIDPGRLVTIDTLMNRTAYRISPAVLYRLVGIRPGDRYRESALREVSPRLASIRYLRLARTPEVGFHDSLASVYLYPEKSTANRFDGWIGLSPGTTVGSSIGFAGALTLDLLNLAGQGEEWLLDWRRNQDRSQKLTVGTNVPYLAGLPFGIDLSFNLLRQDTSYLNTGWNARIPYHFSPDHSLGITFRHLGSSLVSRNPASSGVDLKPFKSNLTGLSWNLNRLDNPINPYRGLYLNLEAATGRKIQSDTLPMRQSSFVLDISWYRPILKNLTCMFGLRSGYLDAPQLVDNEKFRLGGLSTLRGFAEDAFRTDAYAIGSVEIRFLLDRNSHLLLLSDLAWLRNRQPGQPTAWNRPAGLGIGGQIRTAGGIFRIIFAMGKESGQPLQFRNTKIHIGYVGVF